MNKKMNKMDLKKWFRGHWFLILVMVLSGFLLFANIDDRISYGDEMHFILLSDKIVEYGYPYVDDDFIKIDQYAINEGTSEYVKDDVYIWHPWLPFYLGAIPVGIWGIYNLLAYRVFMGLFAFACIPMLYYLSLKLTKKKIVANIASLLLGTSVVFLIGVRQGMYHSLLIFASLLLFIAYFRFLEKKNIGSVLFFVLSAAILFHTHYPSFFALMFGTAIHYLIFRKKTAEIPFKIELKRIALMLSLIFMLTYPWFYYADASGKSALLTFSLGNIILLLGAGLAQILIYIVPTVFLVFMVLFTFRIRKKKLVCIKHEYCYFFILALSLLLLNCINGQSGAPVRYFYSVLPIGMMFSAICIAKLHKQSKYIGLIVLMFMIFSNCFYIFPWTLAKPFLMEYGKNNQVLSMNEFDKQKFVEKMFSPRFLLYEYFGEITEHYVHPAEPAIELIKPLLKPDDIVIVTTPYADLNVISFYLDHEIYPTMIEDADWIVADPGDDLGIDESEYKKYVIEHKNDESNTRWHDSPDPTHHEFVTDREGTEYFIFERLD